MKRIFVCYFICLIDLPHIKSIQTALHAPKVHRVFNIDFLRSVVANVYITKTSHATISYYWDKQLRVVILRLVNSLLNEYSWFSYNDFCETISAMIKVWSTYMINILVYLSVWQVSIFKTSFSGSSERSSSYWKQHKLVVILCFQKYF